MKALRVLFPMALVLIAVFGCKWSRNSNRETTQPATTATPHTSALDNEATATVKEFWEQHTTQCGPSYYGFEDKYYQQLMHQYTGVSFVPRRTGPTTEVDKLNGILWNGSVQIRTGPYREKPKGGEWSEWKQNQLLVEEIRATKRDSGWTITRPLHITDMKKVNCTETEF